MARRSETCASRALGATYAASRARGSQVRAAVGCGSPAATRLRGYVQAVVRTAFTVLLMVSLLGIAACGDDNGEEGGTTAAESDEAQLAKVNLERFLMQDGEEPGFEPIEEPRTDHGVQSLAGGFSADEGERLRRAGF